MSHPELVKQAIDGLQDYKQALIDMHADVVSPIDVGNIRERLVDEGYITHSPLITIPYSVERISAADRLIDTVPWTDPFTVEGINEALKKAIRRESGESAWRVGFPTAFWSTVLDVAVRFDDYTSNEADFGETYARGKAIAEVAHELAHSAFAGVSSSRFSKGDGQRVHVQAGLCISQEQQSSLLSPGSGFVPKYQPMWINEAVANHAAAEVRAAVHPQSIPKEPILWEGCLAKFYGVDSLELSPRYLIYSDEFPDDPGTLSGAEGVGMDILAAKIPSLLPDVKALTSGRLALSAFHDKLRNQIGTELHADITERRPYGTWGSILEQIKRL